MSGRQRGPNTANNNVPIGNVDARPRGPSGPTGASRPYKFAAEARKLADMGFHDMSKVHEALLRTNGSLEAAASILLGSGNYYQGTQPSRQQQRPLSAAEILAGKTRSASALPSKSGVWGGSISGAAMVADSSPLQSGPAETAGSWLVRPVPTTEQTKQDKVEAKHQKFMSTFKVVRCRYVCVCHIYVCVS